MRFIRLLRIGSSFACLTAVTFFALGRAYASEPASAPAPRAAQSSHAKPAAVASNDQALDRMKLDATAITGNRELPKVMSIVPWKSAEPPTGPDRPMGSLIEELLAPVDRDEFRREITYYHGLTSQSTSRDAQVTGTPAASAVPAPGR